MTLVSLSTITSACKDRGFRIREARLSDGGTQLEVFAPDHKGPDGQWYEGACYSCADFVICDRPGVHYGYNGFFFGPWHYGHAQVGDYGFQQLAAHPRMAGSGLTAEIVPALELRAA